MSNRGRQKVASFLARDLGVNWLMGTEYFDPDRQAEKYDPDGRYRRHWLETRAQ
jgi:deoxyribodipyrimidine photo-lyase